MEIIITAKGTKKLQISSDVFYVFHSAAVDTISLGWTNVVDSQFSLRGEASTLASQPRRDINHRGTRLLHFALATLIEFIM